MKDSKWTQDFEDFVKSSPVTPPTQVTQAIFEKVYQDLHPTFSKVFLKIVGIHFLMGATTLLFCPQFGLGFTSGMGLMGFLMRWGDALCMMGCGAFFMTGSLLLASLMLRPEELRVFRKKEIYSIAALGVLSIIVFMLSGATVIASLAGFWMIGSVLGGWGTFEAGWAFRQRWIQ